MCAAAYLKCRTNVTNRRCATGKILHEVSAVRRPVPYRLEAADLMHDLARHRQELHRSDSGDEAATGHGSSADRCGAWRR
jgi:hypothetical protein